MAEGGVDSQVIDLSRYWYILRRRWWIVGCGALLGVALAGAYLLVVPRAVTATAVVNINAISADPFNNTKPQSQLIDPQTEIQLARSSAVIGGVARTMPGNHSLADVKNNTAINALANATVVQISYTAGSSALAVQTADTIAKNYLNYRGQMAAAKVAVVTEHLTKQLDSVRKSLVDANNRLARAPKGSGEAVQAQSDRQLLNIELNALLTQIGQTASVDTNGGTLISNAQDNAIEIAPSRTITLATGALAGLIFGLIAAFVVAAVDRRVFSSRDLTTAGGGDVLSECGESAASIPAVDSDLDDIRSLRERLLAAMDPGSVLVVADLTRRSWASDVGINLAISMAEGGRRVRVVVPEHRAEFAGDLKARLKLEHAADTKRDASTYSSGLVPGLVAVLPPRHGEMTHLSASSLATILQNHAEDFLMTVVALPPTATRSLRLAAGRLGHSIIVVANRRGTRTPDIRRLAVDLKAVSAVIHGSVLVPHNRAVVGSSRPNVSATHGATDDHADASASEGTNPKGFVAN